MSSKFPQVKLQSRCKSAASHCKSAARFRRVERSLQFDLMSDDSAQAEELHDLREQLAVALQHIAEQQRAIADLGRRLEESLAVGGGAPGAIMGAVPGMAAARHDQPPVPDNGMAPQSPEPTVGPVPPARFVVQQAHELPEFSLRGRESLAMYLERFEEHCTHVYAGSINQALPLLKAKLSGPIRDVFIACGDIYGPYQTVKSRMFDWVARQDEVGTRSARDRFRCCQRGQGESLALYALRLASVFNDAYPDRDVQTSQELRQHLLDNLPLRAADYLRRQIHFTREIHGIHLTWKNLLSLLERERLDDDATPDVDPSLFYIAKQGRRSRPSRPLRRTPAPPTGSTRRECSRTWRRREATSGERRTQQRHRERERSSSGSSAATDVGPSPRCYFCGHPGHLERECRRKHGLCFS